MNTILSIVDKEIHAGNGGTLIQRPPWGKTLYVVGDHLRRPGNILKKGVFSMSGLRTSLKLSEHHINIRKFRPVMFCKQGDPVDSRHWHQMEIYF